MISYPLTAANYPKVIVTLTDRLSNTVTLSSVYIRQRSSVSGYNEDDLGLLKSVGNELDLLLKLLRMEVKGAGHLAYVKIKAPNPLSSVRMYCITQIKLPIFKVSIQVYGITATKGKDIRELNYIEIESLFLPEVQRIEKTKIYTHSKEQVGWTILRRLDEENTTDPTQVFPISIHCNESNNGILSSFWEIEEVQSRNEVSKEEFWKTLYQKKWNPHQDYFMPYVQHPAMPPIATKREMSFVEKFHDPLGCGIIRVGGRLEWAPTLLFEQKHLVIARHRIRLTQLIVELLKILRLITGLTGKSSLPCASHNSWSWRFPGVVAGRKLPGAEHPGAQPMLGAQGSPAGLVATEIFCHFEDAGTSGVTGTHSTSSRMLEVAS
ncbi:hypothetical protein LAZ67_X003877 [Cordylochernes scorpioides]|uniref:Uncharacterized protein n=1 Tax=Cordylochernes scorpioides TaxID=51811 RepID=A0ABY6LYL3_9ARAC|nr:hypothetical protein LAZ67_X003877 [Cordylochernes scorpioides]